MVRGKRVAAWVNIDTGFKGTNEDGLLDTSFDPVLLTRFAEMVLVFTSMLEHRQLVNPKALVAVEVCFANQALAVRSVSPTYLPAHGVRLAPAQGKW